MIMPYPVRPGMIASEATIPIPIASAVSGMPASLALAASHAGQQRVAAQQCVDISLIMPTVLWSGTFDHCGRRLVSLIARATPAVEVVFVLDGDAPPAPAWITHPAVTVLKTGVRSGPAAARNRAAHVASGRVLLFVDADVALAEDAIDRVHAAFEADPDLVGLFGSYDDEPLENGAVSAFRNLLHHHTHTGHRGSADTFWAGCGAIRTAEFLDLGGFDENYSVPCVEDIELGMRIAAGGGRIVLDPEVRCKHLKRWTLGSMVFTDIVCRATPWTQLIVNRGRMPAVLNIDWRGRLSGICSVFALLCFAAALVSSWAILGALACTMALIAMNTDFYRLCLKKRGVRFVALAMALHWLYLAYSSLTFGVVAVHALLLGFRRSMARSRVPFIT